MTVSTISPSELHERCQGKSVELIDVRTPLEFQEVHASMAKNVPLDRLDPAQLMAARNGHADEPVYLICRSGGRGKKACEAFIQAGFSQVINVEGGTQAWEAAGLPVKRGKKVVSLERQVRIAAGSLVFLGSALAYFVHPYFIALPAFVGAGLVFAGVTDTCGMGLLLAKMPWNRAGVSTGCAVPNVK